jgi:uncharacterized protein (TIGR02246 family)
MPARKKAQTAALVASCEDIEAQFYEALQTADLDKLMGVWADDEAIVCVHPGGARLVGPAAIRASFEAMFANAPIPVVPTRTQGVESPGCVVRNVIERVDLKTAEGHRTAWVVATNVFVKTIHGWRLVAHHTSQALAHEPDDEGGGAPSVLH